MNMPRYIDADALYKETEKKIKEANSYRMAVVDSEFLDLINDADTADVVPRDEVERIENEIFDNVKKIAQNAIDHFEKHAERAKSAYAASACHSNAIGAEVVLTEIAKYERRFKKKYTKGGEQK
jgi:ribosome-binding ATPase YchF (GTP1/OBG family)